jgi:hypothetical protein
MTHSLHRQGTPENLQNDYVVFTMSAKGYNEVGSAAKMQEFLCTVRRHSPVNVGDMKTGNWFQVEPEKIEADVQDTSIIHAVFTDIDTVAAVLKELQEANLGLSVVVSGLLAPVRETCHRLGMTPAPHTVEHSLGVWGQAELLPEEEVLEVSTMCGHGMVAFGLIEKAVADVKAGRSTPEEAARTLAEPCVCGIFNPVRAAELLKKMADQRR